MQRAQPRAKVALCKKNIMSGKYITTHVKLAALSRRKARYKDIHSQLRQTIEERNRIFTRLKRELR
jgi:hypothetical protein